VAQVTKRPAPAIGLRAGERVDGSRFLHGIAPHDLTIAAGTRVSLRRIAPDGTNKATHVIVFAPALPGISDTKKQLEQARIDAMWNRDDRRDNDQRQPSDQH
jgi:hypothetical protein